MKIFFRSTVGRILFLLLVLHILVITSGGYRENEWIDIPMHLVAGIALGLSFPLFFRNYAFYYELKRHTFIFSLFLLSWVTFLGVGWELFEFWFDSFFATPYGLELAQPDGRDTMFDILHNLLGGIFALYVALKKERNI